MNAELEEIRLQQKAVRKTLETLEEREREVYRHEQDAKVINAEDLLIKDTVTSEQVNYIMGQSAGFVDGFKKAVNVVVSALACEYRDIPMTESELYLLTELGAVSERAWMKDNKQKLILKKNGWKQDFNDLSFPHVWEKKSTDTEDEAEE